MYIRYSIEWINKVLIGIAQGTIFNILWYTIVKKNTYTHTHTHAYIYIFQALAPELLAQSQKLYLLAELGDFGQVYWLLLLNTFICKWGIIWFLHHWIVLRITWLKMCKALRILYYHQEIHSEALSLHKGKEISKMLLPRYSK